jgi:hypothetical protein
MMFTSVCVHCILCIDVERIESAQHTKRRSEKKSERKAKGIMQNTTRKNNKGASMMVYGLLAAVIGLVITGISYSMAPDGGTYTVFTGLIVVGIIYFVMGFFKMLSGR